MKKPHPAISLILTSVLILYCNSIVIAQTTESSSSSVVDVAELRPIIENRIALYAKYTFGRRFSVEIAEMYATDGMLGCARGEKIISKVGEWIRDGIENDSRHLTFKTVTLNADGELLIETGTAEARSDAGG